MPVIASGDLLGDLGRQRLRARQRGVVIRLDAVEEAVAQRLVGPETPPRIGEFADQPLRQQVRDALQRPDIGDDRDVHFLDREETVRRPDAQVARGDEIDAAADAAALNRRDDGDTALIDDGEGALHRMDVAAEFLARPPKVAAAVAETLTPRSRDRARR